MNVRHLLLAWSAPWSCMEYSNTVLGPWGLRYSCFSLPGEPWCLECVYNPVVRVTSPLINHQKQWTKSPRSVSNSNKSWCSPPQSNYSTVWVSPFNSITLKMLVWCSKNKKSPCCIQLSDFLQPWHATCANNSVQNGRFFMMSFDLALAAIHVYIVTVHELVASWITNSSWTFELNSWTNYFIYFFNVFELDLFSQNKFLYAVLEFIGRVHELEKVFI